MIYDKLLDVTFQSAFVALMNAAVEKGHPLEIPKGVREDYEGDEEKRKLLPECIDAEVVRNFFNPNDGTFASFGDVVASVIRRHMDYVYPKNKWPAPNKDLLATAYAACQDSPPEVAFLEPLFKHFDINFVRTGDGVMWHRAYKTEQKDKIVSVDNEITDKIVDAVRDLLLPSGHKYLFTVLSAGAGGHSMVIRFRVGDNKQTLDYMLQNPHQKQAEPSSHTRALKAYFDGHLKPAVEARLGVTLEEETSPGPCVQATSMRGFSATTHPAATEPKATPLCFFHNVYWAILETVLSGTQLQLNDRCTLADALSLPAMENPSQTGKALLHEWSWFVRSKLDPPTDPQALAFLDQVEPALVDQPALLLRLYYNYLTTQAKLLPEGVPRVPMARTASETCCRECLLNLQATAPCDGVVGYKSRQGHYYCWSCAPLDKVYKADIIIPPATPKRTEPRGAERIVDWLNRMLKLSFWP